MSDFETLRAEYDELKKNLLHHRWLYDYGQPEIEDYEYDRLMRRLKELEAAHPEWIAPDSPTQIVEVKRVDANVEHDAPMLSIDDVFSTADVVKFVDKIKEKFSDAEFLVEEKVDGVSATMRYLNGRIARAISRGDGQKGNDITANVLSMLDKPIMKLDGAPPYIELRGEIFISRKVFDRLNSERLENDREPFANPRNYTAGLMNSKNKSAPHQLSFVVHDDLLSTYYGGDYQPFETATTFYDFLEHNGVKVVRHKLCRTAEEVLKAIDAIGETRATLDHALDGAVVKLNNFAQRSELGTTAKAPRWSIAYKFPPEIKRTVVREIELNVGRTGRITPVAIFDPITLAGTTVKRATLHNKDYIAKLDVRIGSTIEVFKSGEIIPKVERVVDNPEGSAPYKFIEECPGCGSKLDPDDWRCLNPNCPAQLESHIINFVGKNAMDIDGLGANTVRKLVGLGLIKNIADIYSLDRATLIDKVKMGAKETDNLIAAIEKSKSAPPERLLTGLGIDGVSLTTALELINQFQSLEKIAAVSVDELNKRLIKTKQKNLVVAESIRAFFDRAELDTDDADPIKMLCKIGGVGAITAREIINQFGTLEKISAASLEELNQKLSKAKKKEYLTVARNVRAFFDLEENKILLERLRAMGLNTGDANLEKKSGGATIVFTGTLTITRAKAGAMAESKGFVVKNSLTSDTKYLVIGEKAGSKLKKAEALGITILNEEQFYDLIKK